MYFLQIHSLYEASFILQIDYKILSLDWMFVIHFVSPVFGIFFGYSNGPPRKLDVEQLKLQLRAVCDVESEELAVKAAIAEKQAEREQQKIVEEQRNASSACEKDKEKMLDSERQEMPPATSNVTATETTGQSKPALERDQLRID